MSDEQSNKENQDDNQWEHPVSREKSTHPSMQKTLESRRIQALNVLVVVIVIIVYSGKFPWLIDVALSLLVLFLPLFIFYFKYLITGHAKSEGLGAITILWFCFSMCAALAIPNVLNAPRSAWENRCRLTLRALGSSELSYEEMNNNNYATFENLVENGYIAKGYHRENLIEKYQIVYFNTKPNKINKRGKIVRFSSFTIIAVPKYRRNRHRTFALSDDQTPRVWVGDAIKWEKEKASLHDINFWEPLR